MRPRQVENQTLKEKLKLMGADLEGWAGLLEGLEVEVPRGPSPRAPGGPGS